MKWGQSAKEWIFLCRYFVCYELKLVQQTYNSLLAESFCHLRGIVKEKKKERKRQRWMQFFQVFSVPHMHSMVIYSLPSVIILLYLICISVCVYACVHNSI